MELWFVTGAVGLALITPILSIGALNFRFGARSDFGEANRKP